ncbi:MAG TPA: zf-HC2 domain-containing protein [Polyangiaceae bacterium]|nr:zf-HC2 domain-containing protein [Polyangiaceae bacterium]
MSNLTCERCSQLLPDYLDGTLSSSDKLAFAAHIESCPRCREGLARYRAIPAVIRSVIDAPMPADVRARLRWILGRRGGG